MGKQLYQKILKSHVNNFQLPPNFKGPVQVHCFAPNLWWKEEKPTLHGVLSRKYRKIPSSIMGMCFIVLCIFYRNGIKDPTVSEKIIFVLEISYGRHCKNIVPSALPLCVRMVFLLVWMSWRVLCSELPTLPYGCLPVEKHEDKRINVPQIQHSLCLLGKIQQLNCSPFAKVLRPLLLI